MSLKKIANAVGGKFVTAKVSEKGVDAQINTIMEKAVNSRVKYNKKVIDYVEFVEVGIGGGTLEIAANILLKGDYLWKDASFVLTSYGIPRGSKNTNYMFLADSQHGDDFHSEKVTSTTVGVDDYIRRMNLLLAKIAKEAKKA